VSAQTALEALLEKMFPRAKRRVRQAVGGFVVALIHPDFRKPFHGEHAAQKQIDKQIKAANKLIDNEEDRIALAHPVLFFENDMKIYGVGGVLCIPQTGDGQDLSVTLHALDAEVALLEAGAVTANRRKMNSKVFTVRLQSSQKPLPMGIKYELLKFGGETFTVKELDRKRLTWWVANVVPVSKSP
jgi:hypothetical protein